MEVPLIRRVRDDEDEQPRRRRRTAENSEETVRDLDDILATLPTQKHEETSEDGEQNDDHEFVRRNRRDRSDRNDRDTRNDRSDRRNRRMRGRDRDNADDDRRYDDRDNRSDRNDRDSRREEPQEDLVPVAGIVDVLDSYAFVRTSGYLPGPNDVYVSMGQVKKYGLRKAMPCMVRFAPRVKATAATSVRSSCRCRPSIPSTAKALKKRSTVRSSPSSRRCTRRSV